MYKIESRWGHQDSIHVEWNLGKRCNFDCGYCPAEIHDNFSPHTPIKTLLHTIDELAEIGKPIRLSLTGGEPSVHPNIEELLEYASQKFDWVNMTTNGTRKPNWYTLLPVQHLVFSVHFDNDHWRRVTDNIIVYTQQIDMDESNMLFQINVMAHHEHMDNVKQCVTALDSFHIPYVVRRIRWTEADNRDWFDDMKYNEKDLQWILDRNATAKANCVIDDKELIHANDIIKKHMNNFEGWKCNAGIESLMINWDGEVHRATCRVGGSLGNIYEGTFVAPEESIICTRKWCTCAADIPLTKVATL
jgi:MoaA/NifB/PqqE/SkfB family radical SAM enzyme